MSLTGLGQVKRWLWPWRTFKAAERRGTDEGGWQPVGGAGLSLIGRSALPGPFGLALLSRETPPSRH